MGKLTPMMAQYKAIKEKYKDCILMFRMGDFYEMFFEDAVLASEIMQITLTSRNKGGASSAPMGGVPVHAIDQYLPKLTRAGKKVAVCDQMTEPNGKGIVEREVVRVVTPGTTFDDSLLDRKANNYVACVVEGAARAGEELRYGFAYADVTTGDFRVTELENFADLENEMLRIDAAECICEEELVPRIRQGYVFPYFYSKDAESTLKDYFGIKSLKVFGLEDQKLAVSAAGMLFEYLKETQKTDLNHIQKISYYGMNDFMPLDEACIRNLELFRTSRGKKEGSLVWVMDASVTAMGGRKLRNWVLHPLLQKADIDARLKEVEKFVKDSGLMRKVREELGKLKFEIMVLQEQVAILQPYSSVFKTECEIRQELMLEHNLPSIDCGDQTYVNDNGQAVTLESLIPAEVEFESKPSLPKLAKKYTYSQDRLDVFQDLCNKGVQKFCLILANQGIENQVDYVEINETVIMEEEIKNEEKNEIE